jgi:hypothetical protein
VCARPRERESGKEREGREGGGEGREEREGGEGREGGKEGGREGGRKEGRKGACDIDECPMTLCGCTVCMHAHEHACAHVSMLDAHAHILFTHITVRRVSC